MAGLVAISGSKIYIGLRVASQGEVDASDFVGQTWTEITGWTNAGSLGDTQEVVSQAVIGEGRARQAKGVKTGGTMENQFIPDVNDPGQTRFIEAIEDCAPYAFKIEWGAGCAPEGEVTISVANPGVITWAGGHGLEVGSPIMFTPTGGTLPTGLAEDTVYYVATVLTPTTFTVSATPGGAGIETTAAGSATSITATAQPAGQTSLFYGLPLDGALSGGDANTPLLRTWSIALDSNIVTV